MNFRKIVFVALFSIAFSICVLLPSDAQVQNREKFTEEFHQSYPLTATGRVSLDNINGGVRVEVWDRNEVKVDATKSADMKEKLQELEILVDPLADSIRIKVKYPMTNWNGTWSTDKEVYKRNMNPGSVDFVLTVPRSARINSIELINGSIDLKDLTGEVKASSINGKVVVKNLMGDSKVSTINGKLEASFDKVDSGRSLSLSSVNGNVQVTLPSDVNAQVKASTVHGGIDNNFGLNVRKGEYVGRDMQGVLGNGGARVNLSNVNGGISMVRANDGKEPSKVTSLISANDSKTSRKDKDGSLNIEYPDFREVEAAFADEMRDAQQEVRDAQREIEQAQRELERNQREVQRSRERLAQNASDEELKDALKDAEDELKDAERELRSSEKELRGAQRELERLQKERVVEMDRMRQDAKRATEDAKRVSVNTRISSGTNEAISNSINAAADSIRVAGDAINGINYNDNLRVIERDSANFKTQGTPRINASTYDGSIVIRAWDKDEVSCTVTKRAEDAEQIKGVKFTATQNGSEIFIKTTFDNSTVKPIKRGNVTIYSANVIASLEINVPRNAQLKINSEDGRIRVEGVNGSIEAQTEDGGIDIRDCNAKVNIKTGDGRVYVVNHQGEAKVETGDGNIVLEGIFTNLYATTGDGLIVLNLPKDINATVEADGDSVLVEGLTATEETGNDKRLKRWRIGTGGPVFKLHTGDGRISVRNME